MAGTILIVDDEGRLKNKPLNERATLLYGHDIIVGDVVECYALDVGTDHERFE